MPENFLYILSLYLSLILPQKPSIYPRMSFGISCAFKTQSIHPADTLNILIKNFLHIKMFP